MGKSLAVICGVITASCTTPPAPLPATAPAALCGDYQSPTEPSYGEFPPVGTQWLELELRDDWSCTLRAYNSESAGAMDIIPNGYWRTEPNVHNPRCIRIDEPEYSRGPRHVNVVFEIADGGAMLIREGQVWQRKR